VVTYLFQDEFNGPLGEPPDSGKWNINTGRWTDNGELEIYTSSTTNCFQDGQSNLVIRAIRTAGRRSTVYTSARINTAGKFEMTHGSFEARIKLNRQPGTWPAFWMMGDDLRGWPWQGEIDIMESYGNLAWAPDSSVHTATDSGDASTADHPIPNGIDGEYHTYMLRHQMSDGNITFLKDGVAYFTTHPRDLPNWPYCTPGKVGVPLFFILNLAIGGTGGNGEPPSTVPFPVDMHIDWVRAWQT
jgi:beta-glucanase (GH16 family)